MFLTLLIFSQWIWDPKSCCWLFSELSDHWVSITRKQWSLIKGESSYVCGQWFLILSDKDRILSTDATNSKSCMKIITITLINHHWPMINHRHHHSHWLTAYKAKCKCPMLTASVYILWFVCKDGCNCSHIHEQLPFQYGLATFPIEKQCLFSSLLKTVLPSSMWKQWLSVIPEPQSHEVLQLLQVTLFSLQPWKQHVGGQG